MRTGNHILRAFVLLATHESFSAASNLIYRRRIVSPPDISSSYDYVIAGGGLAGLVIASRLSEDPAVTVLVLEAGKSGDEVAAGINAPAGAYYSSIVGTDYDWKYTTVPQPNLNNRTIYWPRGKILGGSSAMNAMYLVRPTVMEVDAWKDIISSGDGDTAAQNWGWDKVYENMKKSENFVPPNQELLTYVNIDYEAESYGSGGPMQVSYPAFMIGINANWTSALDRAGCAPNTNPNNGTSLGGYIAPSSINPTNWTRSYSRSAYIDSLPPRDNLHILPESTVVRFLLSNQPDSSGKQIATGVEFASNAESPRMTVGVRKEVILAGGPLGSPKMLQLSGVGPKDVLEAAKVNVSVELPGVGQNLQDHLTAGVTWATPQETAGNIHASGSEFSQTPEFLSFINDAVAFVNISTLFNGPALEFQQQIKDARDESSRTLVASQYPEVVEGYKAIYDTIADKFLPDVPQLELLMSLISPSQVSIQAAMQHPYSVGRTYINSSDPFVPVVIDPQYYSHFADMTIMRQGVRFVRSVGAAYGALFGEEIAPGPGVQTDEQLEQWLRDSAANTQYHPTGSCAMLPKEKGGVVDADLLVYGLANVRVADSSVFPFEFAAHLASATYAVAEQASTLIKQKSYNVPEEVVTGGSNKGSDANRMMALPGIVHLLAFGLTSAMVTAWLV
ncbi:hypothetical protein D9613_007289 [Agrocybe pediades]|uniref:pyranose dehydrogenase (acceptor) n=1 Tax=Agrocybe pediades TaxID=84607 RepID=A0A8H4QHS4_9AGAR|nr:hypothetical protein D9613_007289 [Agrocybe pediades]